MNATNSKTSSAEPQLSPNYLRRFERTWSEYAKEPVQVKQVCSTLYGYGSELACLRIYHRYGGKDHTVGYSKNLGTWYVERDVTKLAAALVRS